ncbi:AraC family transcriptional regulator [Paenibacillus taichungensis]|uniref:AraC family transcriptional regulator n=1 Tax=Paenibacillus taichungensis TaxID=484184 RepID=UPI002872779A|nr:helix-turn-helix domain-containing protein [Paenibacillus taichungensis]MDR9744921.1 helix-turn-helix domain-containing protein [Paenibacillus taichungensis]
MNFASLHPYVYLATRYPFAKGQSSSPRICYTSSIYLISEGYGVLSTNGKSSRLGPDSLIYIPAGQLHEWVADSDNPMVHLCCYFDWHYVERKDVFDTACPVCYPPNVLQQAYVGPTFPYALKEISKVESLQIWQDLFEDFYKSGAYTNEQNFMWSLMIQRNFQTFIDYFLNCCMGNDYVIPDRRISQMLKSMEQDLLHGAPKQLDSYYKSLNMSRGHFFELFRKSTGYSPSKYMNHFRIGRAKYDLLHTTLSITQIAEKYHFSSVHYFSRLFHQLTGQAPRQYRLLSQSNTRASSASLE